MINLVPFDCIPLSPVVELGPAILVWKSVREEKNEIRNEPALILKEERAYEAFLTTPRRALNVSTPGHQAQVSKVETPRVASQKWRFIHLVPVMRFH